MWHCFTWPYLIEAKQLLQQFSECSIYHIPREENLEANNMAQNAYGYKTNPNLSDEVGKITSKILPSIFWIEV